MKTLMVLAAAVAVVLVMAVPAIAQVGQELGNQTQSGDVSLSFSVTGSGSNGSQCVTPLQFGNTGNVQNNQGFLQYTSEADDLSGSAPTFTFSPTLDAPCGTPAQQSSAANGQ